MNNVSLEGKVAIVTGCGTGLGQGIALALAEAGADIVGIAHRSDFSETEEAVKGYGKDGEGEVNGITKNQGASEAQPPGVRPPANKTKARRPKQGRLP